MKGNVVVDYEALGNILRSTEMRNLTKEKANEIAERCGTGYATDEYNAGQRFVCSVYTEDKSAYKDNLENNTLLKGLG